MLAALLSRRPPQRLRGLSSLCYRRTVRALHCHLVCDNWHAEVEAGLLTVPRTDGATYNVAKPPESPG